MSESALHRLIEERSRGMSRRFPGVVLGPGDDCAAVYAGPGPTLITTDQVVEGRHFRAGTAWGLVARKAVGRSVSDIAAMAGTPTACVVTALLPEGFSAGGELHAALSAACEGWGMPLVGGDVATWGVAGGGGAGAVVLTSTVVGMAHPSRGVVTRSGARAGDGVYVTGEVGGSFDRATGGGKHLTFEPRVREARLLADALGDRLRAMIDVSDGVGRDAGRIARASGVRVVIEADRLPMAAGVRDWREAISAGEDYELLFCASGDVPTEVAGTRVTRIGRVDVGAGCWAGGEDAGEMGWEH